MRFPWRRIVRTSRREGRRLAAVVLGIALLVGVLRGGAHYFYCTVMETAVAECCCAGSKPSGGDGLPGVEASDCCETGIIGSLPQGTSVAPAPQPPSVPLTAILPPTVYLRTGVELAHWPRAALERAGPPPPPSVERARLMVFLI